MTGWGNLGEQAVSRMELEGLKWIKSSRSYGATACVELAAIEGGVAVRDSKDRNTGPLRFTQTEWAAFVLAVKDGEFDNLIS